MKCSTFIYLSVCFILTLTLYYFYQISKTKENAHLEICRKTSKMQGFFHQRFSFNYRGLHLISNSNDPLDLVLCPGDAFGDLNDTYVALHEDCYLTMYHQGNPVWSSEKPLARPDDSFLCAASLQKDGNFVIYKETMMCRYPVESIPVMWAAWGSKTDFHPKKTELRIQDQQLMLIHTGQDGDQRVFYAGKNSREFREDLGAPTQVAKEFFIKNHNDTDNVILKRNEYIGDLNNAHLILQTNCELQLVNKNRAIWSFATYFMHDQNCTLQIQGGNSIGISGIPGTHYYPNDVLKILPLNDFIVLQSKITFFEDQLLIIQTLNTGSEITFYSEPGQDNGLKLKREGKQIAKNNLIISSRTILERNDYIGDLDGLHLILKDNCAFALANRQQELWELAVNDDSPPWIPSKRINGPFMQCSVRFNEDGTIIFNRLRNNKEFGGDIQVFGKSPYERGDSPSKFQLFLERNMIIITLQYQNNTPEIYHAGINTNGTWLQFLSDNSVAVNANDITDRILPEMGYIGDINGIFAILNKRGNLILFNKTKTIWESRTTQEYEYGFVLILTRDGNVALSSKWATQRKDYFWSIKTTESYQESQLSKSELFVNNNGMWLVKTYIDGTVKKFKALEETNRFALAPNEEDELESLPSQFYKL